MEIDSGSDKHANLTQHSKSVTHPEETVLGAQRKTIKDIGKKGHGSTLENLQNKDGQNQYKPMIDLPWSWPLLPLPPARQVCAAVQAGPGRNWGGLASNPSSATCCMTLSPVLGFSGPQFPQLREWRCQYLPQLCCEDRARSHTWSVWLASSARKASTTLLFLLRDHLPLTPGLPSVSKRPKTAESELSAPDTAPGFSCLSKIPSSQGPV